MNKLVKKTILDAHSVTVKYEQAEWGHKLKNIMESVAEWGMEDPKQITGK